MPNALANSMLQSSLETRIWLVDGHVLSVRNYTGGTHLECYLDSDLVHAVPCFKRVRRKILLPLRENAATDHGPEDGGRVLTLSVTSRQDALIQTYQYSLTRKLGGETVTIPQHYDPGSGWDVSSERLPGLEHCVTIPSARIATEMRDGPGMEGVVLYKLHVEPLPMQSRSVSKIHRVSTHSDGDGCDLTLETAEEEPACSEGHMAPYAEWKRYNDFDELYTLVHSAYTYYPLDKLEVAKPPGKTLFKKMDADFVESRRAQLEVFLKGLLRLTRISYNPDMLRFLGLLNGRCNPLGQPHEDEPAPIHRLIAALEDDPDDEMLGRFSTSIGDLDDSGGATAAGGGAWKRADSELAGEKLILSLKETVRSVKQAMSAFVPDQQSKKDAAPSAASAARARFLTEALTADAAVAVVTGAELAADETVPLIAAPVLFSAVNDTKRRNDRDARERKHSAQYGGSSYVYVSRVKAEEVAKSRTRRKTAEIRKAQAKQVAALFVDALTPTPRGRRSCRNEAAAMYPGIKALVKTASGSEIDEKGLFGTPVARRSKAEIAAEVADQMDAAMRGSTETDEKVGSAERREQALANRDNLDNCSSSNDDERYGEELAGQIAKQVVDKLIAEAIGKHCAMAETEDETDDEATDDESEDESEGEGDAGDKLYAKIDDELRELNISVSTRCDDDDREQQWIDGPLPAMPRVSMTVDTNPDPECQPSAKEKEAAVVVVEAEGTWL